MNSKTLETLGFCFPPSPAKYPDKNASRNAHFLIGRLYGKGGERDKDAEKQARADGMQQLHSCLQKFGNVILSDEALWHASTYQKKTLFQELAADAQSHRYQIKVIVYLRRQDQFLVSRWSQAVKATQAECLPFPEYMEASLQKEKRIYDYAWKLKKLAKELGEENLIVRRFDPSGWKDGSILYDFLDCLGLSSASGLVFPEKFSNAGLRGNTCEIKRVINKDEGFSAEEKAYLGNILRQLSDASERLYPSRMLSAQETREFLQNYENGNDYIANTYIGDSRPLFSGQIEELPKWTPDNPCLTEDVIRFFSAVSIDLRRANLELQQQNEQLRRELSSQKKNLESFKNKLHHPVRALLGRIFKKARPLACTMALLVCLTGCGGGQKADSATEVRIACFPNITHSQALLLKNNRTLEEKWGDSCNVSWISFNAGPAETEALFAGEVDIGYIGPVPAVSACAKSGGDIQILSNSTDAGAVLLKRKDAGIESLADLSGKTVAVPQLGNTQHLCLLNLLESCGLKTVDEGGDVTVAASANADILNLMDNGTVDAALVPEPWGTTIENSENAELLLDYDEIFLGGNYPTAVVVVRKDFLNAHPELVEDFLAAHGEATVYINEHTAEATGIVNAQIEEATGKRLEDEVINSAFSRMTITTVLNRDAVMQFAEISKNEGFIDQIPEENDVFTATEGQ
ncbi:MAG: aliphatic sulfonate ABC transporter substrate-binding protein [Muribaculaceae bacterium]|nr:aliphatic sulfonate ABC transporter substrate-binding protein [Roseburia sp.]MCM1432301.1 aliphatic sulfonate ABC transporter substrate-binding protein [Muribaculaceae bacterium]MCM1491762.1 aliphatic sulfonate ABC transporter substrate-binding protein [Muribaculaceae bacterium]